MPDKMTLVLGASLRPERYSYRAVKKLIEFHVPVIAVGLREGEIHGVPIQKQCSEISGVHTVTLYIGPQKQASCYDFILKLNPARVVFNPGTENPEFEAMLESRGIEAVRGCTLIMLDNGTY